MSEASILSRLHELTSPSAEGLSDSLRLSEIIALVNGNTGRLHDDTALAEAEARERRSALEEAATHLELHYPGIPRAIAAIRALANTTPETRQPESASLERVRHVKRGTEYEVLGEAEAQVSDGMRRYGVLGATRLLSEGERLVVYRCAKSGKLWCRFTDEFRDGRFVTIAATEPPARIANLDRDDGR